MPRHYVLKAYSVSTGWIVIYADYEEHKCMEAQRFISWFSIIDRVEAAT